MGEETRLRYRYLDLRRAEPARLLRMRSQVNKIARDTLDAADFVEIETPTLTSLHAGGGRDFLVPVRLQPGKGMALPQSPQPVQAVADGRRHGALLYQIARCYRDEDFRADRQPEFTTRHRDVLRRRRRCDGRRRGGHAGAGEGIVGYSIGEIPHLTYADAMARYGTDKPDLRFAVELTELTDYFAETPFRCSRRPTWARW